MSWVLPFFSYFLCIEIYWFLWFALFCQVYIFSSHCVLFNLKKTQSIALNWIVIISFFLPLTFPNYYYLIIISPVHNYVRNLKNPVYFEKTLLRFLDDEIFSKFYDLSGKEIINERQKAIVDSYSVLQNLSKERQLVLQVKAPPHPPS